MENQNYSIDVKSIISNLLLQGLTQENYNNILEILNSTTDENIIIPLIITLDLIEKNSIFLKLKIKECKMHYINKILYMPYFLVPKENGLIYFDDNNYPTSYYALTDELISKIRFINVNIPSGETGIYKEKIIYFSNNLPYKCERILQLNSEGKIINVISENIYLINNEEEYSEKNDIYTGILADILKNNETYVTTEDL